MLEQAELEDLNNEQLRAFLSTFVATLCKRVSPTAVLLAAKEAWTQNVPAAFIEPSAAQVFASSKDNNIAHLKPQEKRPSTAALEAPRRSTSPPRLRANVGPLKLVIRHECRSTACTDNRCKLCSCNPILPCASVVRTPPFSYRPNEPLTAPCGAGIFVEVQTLAGAPDDSLSDSAAILIVAVDAHAYDEMSRRAAAFPQGAMDADLFAITRTPSKGHLLGRHGSSGPMLGFPVLGSRAALDGLVFLEGMEALLPAARAGFRLLATARDKHSGQPLENVDGVLSDAFMVLANPPMGANSGVLRSGSDPLDSLPNVTPQMMESLSDLPRLVAKLQSVYPHFQGFGSPLKSIEKIAQMRSLLTVVLANQFKANMLREALGFSEENWKGFLTDVCKALKPDDYVRCWSCPLQDVQLHVLFACRSGNVDFVTPLGVKSSGKLTCTSQLTEENCARVCQLLPWARAQWHRPGHPGWSITDMETSELLASAMSPSASAPMALGSGPSSNETDTGSAAARLRAKLNDTAVAHAPSAAPAAAPALNDEHGVRVAQGKDARGGAPPDRADRCQSFTEAAPVLANGQDGNEAAAAGTSRDQPRVDAQIAQPAASGGQAPVSEAAPAPGTVLGKRARSDGEKEVDAPAQFRPEGTREEEAASTALELPRPNGVAAAGAFAQAVAPAADAGGAAEVTPAPAAAPSASDAASYAAALTYLSYMNAGKVDAAPR